MRPPTTTVLLSFLSIIFSATAQTPDGDIVPFSTLPACAALCGPLYDVQGGCAPPAKATVDNNCFCADSRLTPFTSTDGTSGVSQVCGPASCSAAADLTAIRSWYSTFCSSTSAEAPAADPAAGTAPTSTALNGAVASSTGSSTPRPVGSANSNRSWISGHYQWVIMICIMFVTIVGGWIGACMLRRRYLRKKERELEMNPPVAWGPHQLQGATGGYNNGDGVLNGNPPNSVGGHSKEFTEATVTPPASNRGSKGFLSNNRFAL
ncbi:uncharacterized protein L3040_009399 [Drepanopeziza brunnea f. sp. 'multigermtubi']|uniref:Integral membrane protein n=1 Tax=Marssonina brunnea f. sp. multigermtubi (strain MB_m1) TaxID=1072389 RepID=K1W4S7_MARBU|nr:uncharacterized protein MBM_09910 [Drepanopeziza brunnea f. sp. 'multigermtubi' MB_m1]EKD11940.1 integral membrane protein [Drepanopeziza brunnea f. sp. 'multigermtubi' MB_m1]KAJ5032807.1 hypothetical protein L3040_009399 [Drepanopeziza brunnea f. sp. 'multigermtubi']